MAGRVVLMPPCPPGYEARRAKIDAAVKAVIAKRGTAKRVEQIPASHFNGYVWMAPKLWSSFGDPGQAPNPTVKR